MKTVAIIGGGMTGLSVAYYAEQLFKEVGQDVRLVLLEEAKVLGGKIRTERHDGFVIELGPDSFLARKTAAIDLISSVGLLGEVVGTNPNARKTYILHKGALHRIPEGLNVGIPTRFLPFASTKLLSWRGKLRAGLDLFLPRGERKDQSLGDFLERRLGKEVVEHMAEPLLAGIYAGDLKNLSIRSTFPQFEQLEQKHGSLIRGMLAGARNINFQDSEKKQENLSSLPKSTFLTLRKGLTQLIETVAHCLLHTEIRLNETVLSTVFLKDQNSYQLQLESGETLVVDALVVTTPAFQSAKLLPIENQIVDETPIREVLADMLGDIPYVSVGNVVLAFSKKMIQQPLDGTGFVVPRTEGRTITACTWISSKWLHSAPEDAVLIRCYVGRSRDEKIVDETDEEIISRVLLDLQEILGIDSKPIFTRVTRWKRAMPQYTVGHNERVQKLVQEATTHYPGFFIGGSAFLGLGIPDCILQGKQLAKDLCDYLVD